MDVTICTGHGRCYTLAPELYEADDDGYCATLVFEVPGGLEEQARKGVTNCPERAISVVAD